MELGRPECQTNKDNKDSAHEVSKGTKTLMGIGLGAICVTWFFYFILFFLPKMNLTVFCPCLEKLYQAEFISNELISFMEEIPRQY